MWQEFRSRYSAVIEELAASTDPKQREQLALSLISSAVSDSPPPEASVIIDNIVRLSVLSDSSSGTVYTRPSDASLMCGIALDEYKKANGTDKPPSVLDPTCGSGVFLLEMQKLFISTYGISGSETLHYLRGVDISPVAAAASRYRLAAATGDFAYIDEIRQKVIASDSLLDDIPDADVVIGNPPYVRANHLSSEYRRRILSSLSDYYSDSQISRIASISDLYIYFILKGISLISDKGVICFIVPNSWMDTVYGNRFRSILSEMADIISIHDFPDRRPFADALVNPCIITARRKASGNQLVNLISLRENNKSHTTVRQSDFFSQTNSGVFLRASDIYGIVLEKARDKLILLGDIAYLRRGITTGANEFFYPSRGTISQFGIEPEYLAPVIKSPKECRRIVLSDASGMAFVCRKDRAELEGTGTMEYILWGERTGFSQRPTSAARSKWWTLPETDPPDIVWIKAVDKIHRQSRLTCPLLIDQRLYGLYCKLPVQLNLILNSVLFFLFREVHGRTSLGEGALDSAVCDAKELPILNPDFIAPDDALEIESQLASRDILPVDKELLMDDRKHLDEIVFKAIGLTRGEADAVIEEVIRLVNKRIERARNFGPVADTLLSPEDG